MSIEEVQDIFIRRETVRGVNLGRIGKEREVEGTRLAEFSQEGDHFGRTPENVGVALTEFLRGKAMETRSGDDLGLELGS